jgi:3-phenylpropionate/trans-cinnamate dioxygenase ferredoxin component
MPGRINDRNPPVENRSLYRPEMMRQCMAENPVVNDPVEAARTTELREGQLKRVQADGKEILLAKANGQFYASELFCPHMEADLSQGTLRGTILTCPMHNSQFDLRDGHVVRWTDLSGIVLTYAKKNRPPRSLKCYPVRVEGGRILVHLS